jgi:hypothetical protein
MKTCVYVNKIQDMNHLKARKREATEQVTKDVLQRAQQDVG